MKLNRTLILKKYLKLEELVFLPKTIYQLSQVTRIINSILTTNFANISRNLSIIRELSTKDNYKLSGVKMDSFKDILLLYDWILTKPKLDKEYCIVFVYNSEEKIRDEIHKTECITSEELTMILESFRQSAQYVYAIDGEINLVKSIEQLKQKHNYILVYSMAQDIEGTGRRSLIPLLCDYLNLINIGSDFFSSTVSSNKKIMNNLILHCVPEISIPKTHYIENSEDIEYFMQHNQMNKIILKPNDESASIGVEVIEISNLSNNLLREKINTSLKKYQNIHIQEFIEGDEIEVTLLSYKNKLYCPGICQIDINNVQNYLNYMSVFTLNYDFMEYQSLINEHIISESKKIAQTLGFNTLSRVDFRIKDNTPYLIDLGANPTISEFSSSNYIFRKKLYNHKSSIYKLLVYTTLIKIHLFEPSFNNSKK